MGSSAALQQQIESTLRTTVPEVEVLLAEQPSPGLVRVTIDRPGGAVDLEVSSPGIERPLVKPDHYRAATGSRVHVRTAHAVDGRRSFTGTLTDARDDEIEIDLDGARARLPYGAIQRAHLVAEQPGGTR
jgi:ribosome maturation factor RimP